MYLGRIVNLIKSTIFFLKYLFSIVSPFISLVLICQSQLDLIKIKKVYAKAVLFKFVEIYVLKFKKNFKYYEYEFQFQFLLFLTGNENNCEEENYKDGKLIYEFILLVLLVVWFFFYKFINAT